MTIEDKLKKLNKLIEEYVSHLTYYSKGEAYIEGDYVIVKYSEPKKECYPFQTIKFPIDDIDKRIIHYNSKIYFLKNKI